jgi:hypothetical protein
MLAMHQLDCEIEWLRAPKLIDVTLGADIKPHILKDLLKVDIPDVRKSVDRARDTLKTLTVVATVANAEKLLNAQTHARRRSAGLPWWRNNARENSSTSMSSSSPGKWILSTFDLGTGSAFTSSSTNLRIGPGE